MQHLTRRHFIQTVSASAAALVLSGSLMAQTAKRKANIIYILADDLGYGDLSCYGQDKFQTPNIDRLASEGIKFTQHYAGSTVCAPSRCVLMTGLHTGHCQIRGNKGSLAAGEEKALNPGTVTIASMLKKAGYTTGMFGKWGLGPIGTSGDPNKQGFDYFFGYTSQMLAHKYYPEYLWSNDDKIMLDNDPEKQTGQYSHDLIAKAALSFIKSNKDKPFFAYIPFTIPHAEITVPSDSLDKYRDKMPEGKPYKPKNEKGYGTQMTPHAAFAGMIDRMDGDVGRILNLLKDLNIDDNTIIMFSSDNGPHHEGGADPDFFNSNGPLRGYKRDLYDGGIREAMLARWPGKIAAGQVTDHISAFWDVLPTIAQVAGITEIPQTDGISFLPTLLDEPGQKQHEYLYWEINEKGGRQAVRMGNFKGIRLNAMENNNGPIELYDLSADIEEKENIADKHPDVVEKIESIMKQAHKPNADFPFFKDEEKKSTAKRSKKIKKQ